MTSYTALDLKKILEYQHCIMYTSHLFKASSLCLSLHTNILMCILEPTPDYVKMFYHNFAANSSQKYSYLRK